MKKRIVSLIASSTEIICALGFRDHLVGRSHECDYPSDVSYLPICTEVKFKTDGSSYEIDERVKAVVQEGLSVYKVKADELSRLKPDVIITQIQCEVCAVSKKDVEEAVCQLIESRPKVVSLDAPDLAGLWSDIQKVADALGAPERGRDLITALKKRLSAIAKKAGEQKRKPTVACIEWMDPLMASGNWVPELVQLAGGHNLFGEAAKHAPWITWDDVVKKDPEVIVILPCGFDIERTRKEMHLMTQRPKWSKLTAVKDKKVFLVDGNQYFNRPGPRLVESLEILAELFHPHVFQFGHKGSAWQT